MDTLTPKLTVDQIKQNIDALKSKGFDDAKIQSYVDNYSSDGSGGFALKNAPKDSSSLGGAVTERFNNISDIQKGREDGKSVLGEALSTFAPGVAEKVNPTISKIQSIKSKFMPNIAPDLATVGQVAGLANDVIGFGLSAITPDFIKKFGADAVKSVVPEVLAKAGIQSMEDYNKWAVKNPMTAKNIEGAVNIASLLPEGKAVEAVSPAIKDAAGNVISKTVSTSGEAISKGKALAGDAVSAVAPKSENIMSNVARINPTDATKFEQMAGKTHGQYLVDTGNFGTPDQIIKKEAEKFAQSVKDVDATLAKLPGTYQPKEAIDVADALTERLVRVKSPEAKRAIELSDKLKTKGLDMSEMNELKRLYERNVKLVHNKAINPDAVALATNMDNSLRNWQFAKADELGFSNIAEMNKQTQLSRFLVDKLGAKAIKNDQLNGVGLSDWIMLSGGNPTAVGGFLTKKFFSDPGVQAKMAKMLSKTEAKGAIKPVLGETKLLRIEAPKGSTVPSRGSGSTIPVAPKGANMEFTGQTGGVTSGKPSKLPRAKK